MVPKRAGCPQIIEVEDSFRLRFPEPCSYVVPTRDLSPAVLPAPVFDLYGWALEVVQSVRPAAGR